MVPGEIKQEAFGPVVLAALTGRLGAGQQDVPQMPFAEAMDWQFNGHLLYHIPMLRIKSSLTASQIHAVGCFAAPDNAELPNLKIRKNRSAPPRLPSIAATTPKALAAL